MEVKKGIRQLHCFNKKVHYKCRIISAWSGRSAIRGGKYETHSTVHSANCGITAQSNCTECNGIEYS